MKTFNKKELSEIIKNTPDEVKNKSIFDFDIHYIGNYSKCDYVKVGYYFYKGQTMLSVFIANCIVKTIKNID